MYICFDAGSGLYAKISARINYELSILNYELIMHYAFYKK